MTDNPYCPTKAEITGIIEETPTIRTVTLKPKIRTQFEAGQFMEIAVPGLGEAPFTPSSDPAATETMEFTIMKAGKVTSRLHELKKGAAVGIRGPYGTGYPLADFYEKEVLIVGGGVGLAPLRSLIFALLNSADKYKKIMITYGARTPKDIVYKNEIKQWMNDKRLNVKLTVDKGDKSWKGNVGLITTLLTNDMGIDIDNSVAIVCGPPIMMKFTTFKLLDLGYADTALHLSMEQNMSCGIGKCGHCRIGPFYACKEGPVFTYDKVKNYHTIWA